MVSAVTDPMRAAGWNVRLTIDTFQTPVQFAGVYQNPRAPTLTFADICAELALCFEFPGGLDSDNVHDPWINSIAFALTEVADEADDMTEYPTFITRESLDTIVPGLSSPSMREPRNVTYHIVRHGPCNIAAGSLKDHLQAQCAHYVLDLRRFHHPSYLRYNKTPSDPRLNLMPLRRKLKARSQSPPKRSAGSTSSSKPGDGDGDGDDDYNNVIAPADMEIDMDSAKKQISDFRMVCIGKGTFCAVSGDGEPWTPIQHIGPGLQACHIVPQQHFHLYPLSDDNGDATSGDSVRRLCRAWNKTWSVGNGILLMRHLHDFFDTRLFSIHPTTLRIRVFMPYKALEPYHGQKANVGQSVDRRALRHHYEMCCIENMAAAFAMLELPSPGAASRISTDASAVRTASIAHTASGGSTPFAGRTDLPRTPSGQMPTHTVPGDPSKRRRPVHEDDEGDDDDDDDDDDGRKRVRREEQYGFDSYITPYNSRAFLADVNYELGFWGA